MLDGSGRGLLYFAGAIGGAVASAALLRVLLSWLFKAEGSAGQGFLRAKFRAVADVEIFFGVLVLAVLAANGLTAGAAKMWTGSGRAAVLAAVMLFAAVMVYARNRPWPGLWVWSLLWAPVLGVVLLFRGDGFLLLFFSPLYLAFSGYLIWLFLKARRQERGENSNIR